MKRRKVDRLNYTINAAIPTSAVRDAYRAELARSIGVGPEVVPDVPPKPTPVPLTEFGAPEFSIEPVKGARAFDVDPLGRLRGVTYDQVWTPGQNESTCRTDGLAVSFRAMSMTLYGHTGGYVPFSAEPLPRPDPHSLVDCKCGFYGYYDGSNDYHKPERVSGVVEGYGEVVIGTRGFRATKARIVALYIPDTVPYGVAARVRHNYRETPCFDTFEAMVTEHPTDTSRGLTPESDPDFWTRP